MNQFKNIKIIGFDLDQTLYPKSPEIDRIIQEYIYDEISSLLKIDKKKAKQKFNNLYKNGKGLSGSKSLMVLGFHHERAREIVQEALENAPLSKFLKPDIDLINLLNNLKSKYDSIDLITGSNIKNTLTKLEKLKIQKNIFSHIITASEASKSDLSAFNLWFSFYPEYKPKNFLYIGDRPSSDYEKPSKIGIKSILVNTKMKDPNINCLQLSSIFEIQKYLNKGATQ